MPRRSGPWFRAARNQWYTTMGGRQLPLGVFGPESHAAAGAAFTTLRAKLRGQAGGAVRGIVPGREPVVLAMLTCDAIHVDPMSKKWFPLGVFTSLAGDRFPLVVPRLAVYACLTECAGRVPVTLRVIDVDEARPPVVDVKVEFPVLDPLAESQMDLTLGRLTFPEPGVYAVQLLWDGTRLAERRVAVTATGRPSGDHPVRPL